MTADHVTSMARTYVTSPFAKVVNAGSTEMLMNLGWSADPGRPSTLAQRQVWLAERLISHLPVVAGQVVADIGCGKGGLTRRIVVHQPTAHVVGVNVDAVQLAVARTVDPARDSAASPDYIVGAAECLPFRTNSVDAALVVELLGHLTDKAAFWSEVSRVVRPGGHLVLAAITLNRPFALFDATAQAHLALMASYFIERAEDLPLATGIRTELERRAWCVQDEDLSAGVYGPRHEEMRAVLLDMDSPNAYQRAASREAVRLKWATDPEVLADYLRASTSSHALRYYEYHLFTATAS